MTWSITVSGTKSEAKAQLASTAPLNPELADAPDQAAAKSLVEKLVDASPDGSTISCNASGHRDAPTAQHPTGFASFSFSAKTS